MSARQRVLYQFKELIYMGKDYSGPHKEYISELKQMYSSKRHLTNEAEIENALAFGEYMKKELIALHKLRIYRAMKRRYY